MEYDSESEEIHVMSDMNECMDQTEWFNFELCPLLVTVSKIGSSSSQSAHVVDATIEEEACSTSQIVMGVDTKGRVSGCRKYGTHSLSFSSFATMMDLGTKTAKELHDRLKQQLIAYQQSLNSALTLMDI